MRDELRDNDWAYQILAYATFNCHHSLQPLILLFYFIEKNYAELSFLHHSRPQSIPTDHRRPSLPSSNLHPRLRRRQTTEIQRPIHPILPRKPPRNQSTNVNHDPDSKTNPPPANISSLKTTHGPIRLSPTPRPSPPAPKIPEGHGFARAINCMVRPLRFTT